MTRLAALGLAVSAGLGQSVVDLLFANVLDPVGRCRQGTFLEALAKERFQRLTIGKYPSLHALHHQVALQIVTAVWLVPLIALSLLEMQPGLFALTDRTWHIEEEHIHAAMAWVRYATDSAGFVLTGGNNSPSRSQVEWAAGRISAFLAAKGFASRRDLVVNCFGRHQPATVVDAAITHLMESAPGTVQIEVQSRSRAGPGRPSTIYRLVRPHMPN